MRSGLPDLVWSAIRGGGDGFPHQLRKGITMTRWIVGGMMICGALVASGQTPAFLQPAPGTQPAYSDPIRTPVAAPDTTKPTYKYPIKPEVGPYLIIVQSFTSREKERGDPKKDARVLAEDMADHLRKDFRLPTYLHDWGWEERIRQEAHLDAQRRQVAEALSRIPGASHNNTMRVKRIMIDDQFAVFVGGFQDMKSAKKVLDELRDIKETKVNNRFCHTRWEEIEEPKGSGRTRLMPTALNPFKTAMVVRNPSLPPEKIEARDPTKLEDITKEMNSGREFNLLKCKKDWTVVVRIYQAPVSVVTADKPKAGASSLLNAGEGLSAGAMQAESLAGALRAMKYEAYVLHDRYSSVVTVGGFDSVNDKELLATQKQLAGAKFGTVEELMVQPLPMQIPR